MSTLPLQGAANDQLYSLTRDTQLRTELESSFNALWGQGVVSGGVITAGTGLTAQVAAGSRFFSEGVSLVLTEAAVYGGPLDANRTCYLWAKILRTAADQEEPTESDTYSLSLVHNITGVAPSALHFPLAILTTGPGSVLTIDNAPPGKYLRELPNGGWVEIALTGSRTTLTETQYRNRYLRLTSASGAVIFPAEAGRGWTVANATAGTLTLTTADGAGVELASGDTLPVWTDGTDVLPGAPILSTVQATLDDTQAELDEARREFRALLFHLVKLGIPLPSRLAGAFTLAAREQSLTGDTHVGIGSSG